MPNFRLRYGARLRTSRNTIIQWLLLLKRALPSLYLDTEKPIEYFGTTGS